MIKSPSTGTRALQIAVAICSLVPISAGGAGILLGPALVTHAAGSDRDLDSHFRYLSGLLLGIGFAYLTAIPGIERKRLQFLLLGGIVVIGGLARLGALLSEGAPSAPMLGGLAMELVVTPLLTLWQLRVSTPESAVKK
jgi:Domain of unknown function (DUF4345)